METLRGNALIFTQGGPTSVINGTIVGAVQGFQDYPQVEAILGAVGGTKGILAQELVDLGSQTLRTLRGIEFTPASALSTTRHKPSQEECRTILRILEAHHIRFVVGIGGNDTSETLAIINNAARTQEYELRLFHAPKTIDNDLVLNDHTPGYGSAARFVAQAFMGANLDNRAFGGLYIAVCMGRHAGFLTAASALGRRNSDDGPHLVYVPERPFSIERFVEDVWDAHQRLGRCVIAVSEGITDENETPILQRLSGSLDQDVHGNVQLSGTGALGDGLTALLTEEFKKRGAEKVRARADTFGYLQRSFPHQSEVDRREALEVGRFAAQQAMSGNLDGSIIIVRDSSTPYKVHYERVDLEAVAGKTRVMPDEFINKAGNDVTPAFVEYARPLVGDLAPMTDLERTMVPKVPLT